MPVMCLVTKVPGAKITLAPPPPPALPPSILVDIVQHEVLTADNFAPPANSIRNTLCWRDGCRPLRKSRQSEPHAWKVS